MSNTHPHGFPTASSVERIRRWISRFSVAFWFALSLGIALSYSMAVLPQAFSGEYVVGDDAREYLFWMYRFSEPQLFPNDLIANYFQSITPVGYAALYHLMNNLGVKPVLFSKLLPLVLALFTTGYGFAVYMRLLPVPIGGFFATLLLNQAIWMRDEIVSATPRSFFYPLFLAFLYYLLKRSLLPCLVVIALQALFYPIVAFISSGILLLRLLRWQRGIRLSHDRNDYLFCVLGIGVALLTLIPYILASSEFGPTITAAEARRIPEYWSGGRVSYYKSNLLHFWLDGRDSGMFALLSPPQLFIGALLPFVLLLSPRPLTQQVNKEVKILLQIVLVSISIFFIAHALAFKLHFPSRFTFHTFRMVLSLAAGIVLTLMLNQVFQWLERKTRPAHQGLTILITVVVVAVGVLYPFSLKVFPKTQYLKGNVPELYQFLQQQPPDSIVASVTQEANNLPTFAKRPILVAEEYALPFHTKYYTQFRQRAKDLIVAQYSPELQQVKQFIHKYHVSFWLLERTAFKPKYIAKNWIKQYQPEATQAIAQLEQGATPALQKLMQRCTALETEKLVLLQAECLNRG